MPGDSSAQNFFAHYSIQGEPHKRSYMKQVVKGSDKYTFIAVDACLAPGPKRPYNFIGVLSSNETKHIVALADEARQMGSTQTIWFGHYPSSCVASMGNTSLGQLIGRYREGLVYLSGHLHTLGGLVPRMYALQPDGFLELELADWKKGRM